MTQINNTDGGPNWNTLTNIYTSYRYNVNNMPLACMDGGNTVPVGEGLSGAIDVPANTCSSNSQANGVAGYARTESAVPAVGVFGAGLVKANNTNTWGGNFIASNVDEQPFPTRTGFEGNNVHGIEIDVCIQPRAGGAAPGGNAYGVLVVQGSAAIPGGEFNAVHTASVAGLRWNTSFNSATGAAQIGLDLWPLEPGNSKSSQPIYLRGSNASGSIKTFKVQADLSGNLHLTPPDSTSGTYIENSAGTTRLQATNNGVELFGTVKVNGVDIGGTIATGGWVDFVPTLGGYSSQPTKAGCRYKRIGNIVVVNYDCFLGGTSNNSFMTCTLPFRSANTGASYVRDFPCRVRDNGLVVNGWGLIEFDSNATEFSIYKDAGGATGWASSGQKGFRATITYECES